MEIENFVTMDFSLLPALYLSLTRFSLMQLLWEFINLPLSAHFTATYSVINYEEQKLNFLQNRVEHLDENITFRCELSLGFTNFFFSRRWLCQLWNKWFIAQRQFSADSLYDSSKINRLLLFIMSLQIYLLL